MEILKKIAGSHILVVAAMAGVGFLFYQWYKANKAAKETTTTTTTGA